MKSIFPFSILLFSAFISCKKKSVPAIHEEPNTNTYLHISHTRTQENPEVDAVVAGLDFSNYDMLWLGGDLAAFTSADFETMDYMDELFNLSSPNTLWSLGNHDYSDVPLVTAYTQRPSYYSSTHDGICILVLDTQSDQNSFLDEQLDLIKTVVDTIAECSHLILLHHHLVWLSENQDLEPNADQISNAPIGNCGFCIHPNNFYSAIYPELLIVENKGIEVICIAGDIGRKSKEFRYETAEGITFLASGIESGEEGNKALLVTHDLETKSLKWEFKLLTEL